MPRAYLEPSAINAARAAGHSGRSAAGRLSGSDLTPVIGVHAVYELAKGFLTTEAEHSARANFQLIHELDPSYGTTPGRLTRQELQTLRTGAAVLPFLDTLNQASIRTEVFRLASGAFSADARALITQREEEMGANRPRISEDFLTRIKQARADDANSLPRSQDFEDVVRYFEPQFPQILGQIFGSVISAFEIRELSHRLPSFPATRALVRANLYMAYIMLAHETTPGGDKVDDYRHVIEASYCDYLVTADRKLLGAAPRISPGIRTIDARAVWQ
jgi:hypothetical protein